MGFLLRRKMKIFLIKGEKHRKLQDPHCSLAEFQFTMGCLGLVGSKRRVIRQGHHMHVYMPVEARQHGEQLLQLPSGNSGGRGGRIEAPRVRDGGRRELERSGVWGDAQLGWFVEPRVRA